MKNSPFKLRTDHSTLKSYATYENALKAFNKIFGNIEAPGKFMIIRLDEFNSTNEKYFGRFIPVCIGINWMDVGAHWSCHVVS